MGQKVNPISFRLPITKAWSSSWFKSKKEYSACVIDDLRIHRFFKPLNKAYSVKSIKIDRVIGKVIITVFTAKPGIFIKKAEDGIENLINKLSGILGYKVSINVMDVKNPSLSATLVGAAIATQIEKRASYVRVIKKASTPLMLISVKLGNVDNAVVRVTVLLDPAAIRKYTLSYKSTEF
mgnify:CR=1 FL=1